MEQSQQVRFAGFMVDLDKEEVWEHGRRIPLRPKLFAILRYLVEHSRRLVTRDQLTRAAWPDTIVSESVLRGCIRELREILGDTTGEPQFIETVPRRGYRFIASLVATVQRSPTSAQQTTFPSLSSSTSQASLARLIGRDAELTLLHAAFAKAKIGQRQMVFVTGEPGIGKTTLVDAYLAQLATKGLALIGRGQCVEQYGAGEAYLPVLEIANRLGRAPGGERLHELLNHYAPTWLVQLPGLVQPGEVEDLQRRVAGVTRERMLREAVDVLEAVTAEVVLVVVLEDLHWSDHATIDLLALIARRREAARLLIIGTYRPADVVMSGHPLRGMKQELQVHGYCQELTVRFLNDTEVAHYLDARFPAHAFPPGLASLLYQHTEGNPLFMVNTVDDLVAQGLLYESGAQWRLQTPLATVRLRASENVRQLIERQLDRLSEEERHLLEVASVAGVEFTAALLSAGGGEGSHGEEICDGLVRRGQFLREHGIVEWPDGTVTTRYGFLHALYQNVAYGRLPAGRRVRLHQQVGVILQQAYGERTQEIAAELAMHFERGRDGERALHYHEQAAQTALQRNAFHEAITHLTRALELLSSLPDAPERTRQELMLQTALGTPLIATKGYGAPEVAKVYARARELCQQAGDIPQIFLVLFGLWGSYLVRAELPIAHELGEQLMRHAQGLQDPALIMEAHMTLGFTLLAVGELAFARAHFEQGAALYDLQQHRSHAFLYGQDPGMSCLSYTALILWFLGHPDQALEKTREALTLTQELSHPYSQTIALNLAALLHKFRREEQATQEQAEAIMTLSTEQGFPLWSAQGAIQRGWALTEQGQGEEGIVQMQKGLDAWKATGAEVELPLFLAFLAEAYGKIGQVEKGLRVLAEALERVHMTGECFWEAELYRLKGELTLQLKAVDSTLATRPKSLHTSNPKPRVGRSTRRQGAS